MATAHVAVDTSEYGVVGIATGAADPEQPCTRSRQVDDEQQRAAILAILWRVEKGMETPANAYTVLQALGIEPTPAAPKATALSTRQRRQAARRAQREEEAS